MSVHVIDSTTAFGMDRVDFFDVAAELKPGLTLDEYEAMWNDYTKAKAEHIRELNAHAI